MKGFAFVPLVIAICVSCAQKGIAPEKSSSQQVYEKETLVNGKREGQYLRYYPGGAMEMSCNYREGILDGPVTFYFPEGNRISRTATYKNGLLTGLEHSYYEDGTLQSVLVHREDNSLSGADFYYPDGDMAMSLKSSDVDDQPASFTFYHENGVVSEIVYIRHIRPVGHYVAYYDNGVVKKEGDYENGRLSGVWKFYDRNGNLTNQIEY